MNFVIIIVLSILLILYKIFFYKTYKIIYLKKFAFIILCILFIFCLILFSETALNAAKSGISLCLNIVFPSLFPFFVGSEILYKTGIIKAVGVLLEPVMRPLFNVPGCGSFPFAMGITSGYPIGAKLTVNMRQENLISKIEAERLIAFTNNSGPLFIIGAVAVGMYNMPKLGVFLLACHIGACITVGLLFRFYRKGKDKPLQTNSLKLLAKFRNELKHGLMSSQASFGTVLGDSIKNSIGMMLSIGGFIIFFSVIIKLLLELGAISYLSSIITLILSPLNVNSEIIPAIVSGFFEITTGSNMASSALNTSLITQLTAASMIIGWAGLSVHSQVLSIISKSDISIKPYLIGKLLQGLISGFYTYLIIKIAEPAFLGDRPAFFAFNLSKTLPFHDYISISCISFIICIVVLFLIAFIYVLKKLF
jgi:sporulation integral membrane protein YlbJ